MQFQSFTVKTGLPPTGREVQIIARMGPDFSSDEALRIERAVLVILANTSPDKDEDEDPYR